MIGFCLGLLVLLCLLGFFESLVLLERTIFKGLKIFYLFFKICFDCYEVCCLFYLIKFNYFELLSAN